MRTVWLILGGVVLIMGSVWGETVTRRWVVKGEDTGEAKLVSREESGEAVVLERVSGGTFTVTWRDLSETDREYVETVFPTVPNAVGSRPEDLSEEALEGARALLPEEGKGAVIHHVLKLAAKGKVRVEIFPPPAGPATTRRRPSASQRGQRYRAEAVQSSERGAGGDLEGERRVFFETDLGDELWALLREKNVYGIEIRDLNHRNRAFRAAPSGGTTCRVAEGKLRLQVENLSGLAITVVLYSGKENWPEATER